MFTRGKIRDFVAMISAVVLVLQPGFASAIYTWGPVVPPNNATLVVSTPLKFNATVSWLVGVDVALFNGNVVVTVPNYTGSTSVSYSYVPDQANGKGNFQGIGAAQGQVTFNPVLAPNADVTLEFTASSTIPGMPPSVVSSSTQTDFKVQ